MRSLKLETVGSITKIDPVSSDYKGKQYWYMYGKKTTDRYSSDFLNERENFFHKPLVNLNHFYDINDDIRLSSVIIGVVVLVVVQEPMVVLVEHPGRGRKMVSSPWMWDWNTEIIQNSSNIDSIF